MGRIAEILESELRSTGLNRKLGELTSDNTAPLRALQDWQRDEPYLTRLADALAKGTLSATESAAVKAFGKALFAQRAPVEFSSTEYAKLSPLERELYPYTRATTVQAEAKTMTRADFDGMSPSDRMAFSKSGGKLTD